MVRHNEATQPENGAGVVFGMGSANERADMSEFVEEDDAHAREDIEARKPAQQVRGLRHESGNRGSYASHRKR